MLSLIYNTAIKILQWQTNYSEDNKLQFQVHEDCAYLTFHLIYGQNIATNYCHMLSPGQNLWL